MIGEGNVDIFVNMLFAVFSDIGNNLLRSRNILDRNLFDNFFITISLFFTIFILPSSFTTYTFGVQ